MFDGSDIWRATGPADALVWSRVTGDGFGDTSIHNFESFCTYEGQMYVAASNLFSANPGADRTVRRGGAKIYRLKEIPQIADIASLAAVPARFKMTLAWTSTARAGLPGL